MLTLKVFAMSNIFRLKVSLKSHRGDGYPSSKCSRVLDIQGTKSLVELAETIIDAFDFNFDHAFGFYSNLKNYYDSEECYTLFADTEDAANSPAEKSVSKNKVKDAFAPEKSMLFVFNYGDEWTFGVKCLSISPAEKGEKYPKITERKGASLEQYPEWEEAL